MKTLTKSIALVAVTTLFATAFSTAHLNQHPVSANVAAAQPVPQIVILGQRMTTLEKAQFDMSQADDQRSSEALPKGHLTVVHLAVK